MSTKLKIAFVCNFISVILLVAGGLIYFFSTELMPYHQEVLGIGWNDLDTRYQLMLRSFLKGAGLAALVPGIAMGILLFIPFQRGDAWARWAIPTVGLLLLLPTTYIAAKLANLTGVNIPWQLLLIPTGLLIFGYFLSGDL